MTNTLLLISEEFRRIDKSLEKSTFTEKDADEIGHKIKDGILQRFMK